jgi:hypothetical protein
MEIKSQRPEGREDAISALNAAIESLRLAVNISSITPAKTVFRSVSTLLTTIRVCFLLFRNGLLEVYIELGLNG